MASSIWKIRPVWSRLRSNHGPISHGAMLLSLLAFLLLLASYANGQLYTGSIAGTVTDPSGAVLSGARVKAVDQQKGFSFPATTDSSGRYVVRELPPGLYSLSVEAAGFRSERKEGISLDVNQNVGVDFSLKVGTPDQVIDVQAGGVELETQDAVTGQVIDRRFINDLPLVGRNVLDLAYLTPGITGVDNQCQDCTMNNFISNGSRNATADILLDGVSSTNFEQNSGVLAPTYTPSVDAVEEFKVQQSNFSAEYGFTGATLVNVVTRSGTNAFHGSLYEFLRNDKLDANDWFNNQAGLPKQPLRLNDFGGTIGGPIRKNRTFFFFDYEGTRTRRFRSHTLGVPTLAERGGDFGDVCTLQGFSFDSNGICSDPSGQLWDPFSVDPGNPVNPDTGGALRTTPIPFNNLATYASPGSSDPAFTGTPFQVASPGTPGNLIDPVAAKLMQLFPKPNLPVAQYSDTFTDFFSAGTNKDSQNQFDIKIDHRFSDSKLLSGKYAERRDNFHSLNCFGNEADPCTGGPVVEHDHLFALNYTQTFSPTLVMNLSYGLTRGAVHQPGITGDFPNLDAVTDLGFPSYMDVSGFKQFPAIEIDQYMSAGGVNIGTQTFSIIREGQETHTALGSIDWVRGNHDFKFGAELRAHRINFAQPGWPGGAFGFDFSATSQDATGSSDNSAAPAGTGANQNGGDAMASFLTGIGFNSSGDNLYEVPNNVATQNFQFGGFVQDNFRATPKLTLNLGLRYEVSLPRTERFNRMNWLDPNVKYTLEPSPLAPPGTPPFNALGGEVFVNSHNRYNYDTFYKGFQPRLGFAYQMPHDLVLRGGYGIFFSQPRSGAAGTGPWGYEGFDVQTPWITTFQNADVLPGSRLSDPFRSFQAPYADLGPKLPPGSSLGVLNDIGFDAVGPIPSISRNLPYEQAWTFGFQKGLPGKIVVDASYIGKKGTHLYLGGFRDMDRLGPQFEQLLKSGKISTQQIQDLARQQVANPLANYITDPLSNLSQATVHPYQDANPDPFNQINGLTVHVPFPQFTSFSGDSPPIANSIYHAAQFRVEKGFSNGLQFLVTYTISKSIDSASTTDDSIAWLGGGLNNDTLHVQDPNNLRAERALSTFDIPQVLQFSYVYALPIGRGKRFGGNMRPVLNGFIGGWQLNGIWRFDNGRPILLIEDDSIRHEIPTYGQRPTLTGPLKVNHSSQASMVEDYFANACDPANVPCPNGDPTGVVTQTPQFTLGNAPRTYGGVRAPGTRNVSMALFKEFPMGSLREGMRLEFRMEAFNVFNHPQFDAPDTTLGDGSFGQITQLANPSREVQLGLKLYF
jgi:hypothetical protein